MSPARRSSVPDRPEAEGSAPRFSVVIPAHDAAATIGPAIRSVLDQGRTDVEVIVVDDASQDGTAEHATQAARGAAGQVSVLRQPRNAGVSAARNAGLAAACGEIVIFLDADDVHLPGFLATVEEAMQGDVDAVVLGRRVVSGGSSREEHAAALGEHTGPQAARATMCDRITPFPWDKAFRRTLLGTAPFPEGVARFEDLATVIVALSRARRVRVLATPVIEYRVSAGSLTWGRVPTRAERDAALEHMRRSLDPVLVREAGAEARALRTLLTILIAQGAALHAARVGASERAEHVATLRRCRGDLSLRDITAALRRSRSAGIAAAILFASPAVFTRIVSWRVGRRYGGSATSETVPDRSIP